MSMDWDSPLVEDEYNVLPRGEYLFSVKRMIKTVSEGDKTRGACMAKLELLIYDLADTAFEKPLGIGFDNLILHKDTQWKVCQFFIAIGERKSGERIIPPWDMVPASTGRAIFFPQKFNGKESMKVEEYLDPNKKPADQPAADKDDNLKFD